jgi:cell division transport system permease protein
MALSAGYVVRETATNLRRNLLMTIASVMTIFISLSFVGSALLVRQGVAKATARWRGGVELSIFMQPGASPSQNEAIERELDSLKGNFVKKYTYVDKRAAYQEFLTMFKDSPDLREGLTEETITPSYRVVPVQAEQVEVIGKRFKAAPGVHEVVYAKDVIDRLLEVTRRNQVVALSIAVVLLISATLLIFNTIQMAIFARRREVAVMKLVGATNWFIRIPFMLEGTIQGMVGAGLAFAVIFGFRNAIVSVAAGTASLIEDLNTMTASSAEAIGTGLFLMALGGLAGAVGSAIAVRRFLDV